MKFLSAAAMILALATSAAAQGNVYRLNLAVTLEIDDRTFERRASGVVFETGVERRMSLGEYLVGFIVKQRDDATVALELTLYEVVQGSSPMRPLATTAVDVLHGSPTDIRWSEADFSLRGSVIVGR